MVRMRSLGLSDYSQYYTYLENNEAEFTNLLDVLTINLSYFFRNPETFEYLQSSVFPALKKRNDLTLWSAGCARGEEPYSLAIVAAETHVLDQVTIYGTDIDKHALKKAEIGTYPQHALQYVPKAIVNKYFDNTNDGFRVTKALRSHVQFIHVDLFEAPPFGPCDLIVCRNVLIYLDRQAQSLVLRNFYNKLKPRGYFVIGKVELLFGIPEAKLFEIVHRTEHIYKKIEAPAH